MTDRILYNAKPDIPKFGKVDEIVVHDCLVHLEQMDDGHWYIGLYKEDGTSCQIWINKGKLDFESDIRWEEEERESTEEAIKRITEEHKEALERLANR